MAEPRKILIMYEGENIQPGDTVDMKPVASLDPKNLEKIKEIDTFWSKIPHTWIEYELFGVQLINGRQYEIK